MIFGVIGVRFVDIRLFSISMLMILYCDEL